MPDKTEGFQSIDRKGTFKAIDQNGFRQGRSAYKKDYGVHNKNLTAVLLFVDFFKAFD